MERLLELVSELPTFAVYVILGGGGLIENLIPALPADTFVLLGGFVAGRGTLTPLGVFTVVWACNVVGAVAVYGAGLRYGHQFFRVGPGRRLLAQGQMSRVEDFYAKWGAGAIFLGRFLPGIRALVPAFAGVAKLSPGRVLVPLLLASALWYGALVRLGYLAGNNLERVVELVERMNRGLLFASIGVVSVLVVLWWRSRETSRAEARQGRGSGDAE